MNKELLLEHLKRQTEYVVNYTKIIKECKYEQDKRQNQICLDRAKKHVKSLKAELKKLESAEKLAKEKLNEGGE